LFFTIYWLAYINLKSFLSDGLRQNKNGPMDIDDVPPDSNLTIKLELVSWKSVIDVTGDKKVLKRITRVGEGFDRPNEGSVVKGNLMYKTYPCLSISLIF
jgi:hypothetical protein